MYKHKSVFFHYMINYNITTKIHMASAKWRIRLHIKNVEAQSLVLQQSIGELISLMV